MLDMKRSEVKTNKTKNSDMCVQILTAKLSWCGLSPQDPDERNVSVRVGRSQLVQIMHCIYFPTFDVKRLAHIHPVWRDFDDFVS